MPEPVLIFLYHHEQAAAAGLLVWEKARGPQGRVPDAANWNNRSMAGPSQKIIKLEWKPPVGTE